MKKYNVWENQPLFRTGHQIIIKNKFELIWYLLFSKTSPGTVTKIVIEDKDE